MEKKTKNQQIIADDILRYKKNKLASGLALLGLVFNCLYFMILYALPNHKDKPIFTVMIGASVLFTLIVLLAIFYASEGVKGYNKKFAIVLLVCAVFQIARIFYYPLNGLHNNTLMTSDANHTFGYFGIYFKSSTGVFILMLIYLLASAACLIGAAVWGWIVAVRLEKFQKALDNGEISVEATLKEMDAEDTQAPAAVSESAQPANEEVQ